MTNRIVLAYFGDQQSAASIATLAATDGLAVIAVALDLGEGIPLNELRDGALAAGAVRCHALDVREEFLREAILPALRANQIPAGTAVESRLAAAFVTKKIQEMGEIEQAVMIEPERTDFALASPASRAIAVEPAYLDIRFADGVPFAVNEIPMTLIELTECIDTIAGVPAIDVLQLAYQELDGSDEGQVVLRIENGQCTVTSSAVVL